MKNYLSNTAYDILKILCITILPAFGTLYFALAGIWGFPYGEQVVGTINAITTCIGIIIGRDLRSRMARNPDHVFRAEARSEKRRN